jgi:hypothetical protein
MRSLTERLGSRQAAFQILHQTLRQPQRPSTVGDPMSIDFALKE